MLGESIIVGGGARGIHFAGLLAAQHRKVAAVVDSFTEGFPLMRKRLGDLGAGDVQLFPTLNEALESGGCSAVDTMFIMTPEWTHYGYFREGLRSGFHIFMEKPLAAGKSDLLEMIKLNDGTDKIVQVGFVLRYTPFYSRIKAIVDSGVLGKLVTVHMNERLSLWHGGMYKRNWRRRKDLTGGFLNEKCSHDLDIMCWLKESGGRPLSVFSMGSRGFCSEGQRHPGLCRNCRENDCPWQFKKHDGWRSIDGIPCEDETCAPYDICVYNSDADIYDNQTVTIGFSDGTHGMFSVAAMSPKEERDITLHGTEGFLTGRFETGEIRFINYRDNSWHEEEYGYKDFHGGGDERIMAAFLECIDKGVKPLTTMENGAQASFLAFAADESLEKGCPVFLELDFSKLYVCCNS